MKELRELIEDIRRQPAVWAGDFLAVACAALLWVVLFFL